MADEWRKLKTRQLKWGLILSFSLILHKHLSQSIFLFISILVYVYFCARKCDDSDSRKNSEAIVASKDLHITLSADISRFFLVQNLIIIAGRYRIDMWTNTQNMEFKQTGLVSRHFVLHFQNITEI